MLSGLLDPGIGDCTLLSTVISLSGESTPRRTLRLHYVIPQESA